MEPKPDKFTNKKEEWDYFQTLGTDYIVEARDNWRNIHTEVGEDVKFCIGIQWTQEDLEYFISQKIPPLVINHIRGLVQLGAGYQRQFHMKVRLSKRIGEPDVAVTAFNRVFDTYDNDYHWNDNLSGVFKYGFLGGISYGGYRLDYTRNPLKPRIVIEDLGPYAAMRDPYSTSLDLRDDRYLVIDRYVLPGVLKSEYAEQKTPYGEDIEDLIEASELEKDQGDRAATQVLYMKDYRKQVYYVALEDSDFYKRGNVVFTHEKGKRAVTAKKFRDPDKFEHIEGNIEIMKKAVFLGDKTMIALGDTDFPELMEKEVNGGYPAFVFIAEWWKHDTKWVNSIQGVGRQLRDVQKDKNARRIQQNRLLGQVAGEGWIQQEGALKEGDDYLISHGNQLGKILTVKANKEAPEKIQTDISATGMAMLEDKDDREFNFISGVNTEILAHGDPKALSGEAIRLRQRQGTISLQDYLDNYRFTRKVAADIYFTIADEKYTDDDIASMISLTSEEEQQAAQLMQDEGFNISKYTAVVGDAINEEQQKAYDFNALMQVQEVQLQAGDVLIPTDIILRTSGISNAEEIIQRLEEARKIRAQQEEDLKEQLLKEYQEQQSAEKQPAGGKPARSKPAGAKAG